MNSSIGPTKISLLFLLALGRVFAQDEADSRGFLMNERMQGSASPIGLITKFDTAVGYQFNRYLALEGGVPFYLVNPSATAKSTGAQAQSGLGNAYADLRLSLANPAVNYSSVVTIGAPTGDKSTGFSTGHATYDWSNIFDRRFGRAAPFVNLGIANTIADEPYFTRPYSSFGFIAHFEGGATYKLARAISVGGSLYAIAPSGQQTVISKLIPGKSQNPGAGGTGRGRNGRNGVFETASETVGSADIARDHGVSVWFSASPSRYAEFEMGYSRSAVYALNSVFFGVDFKIGPLIGRRN